MTDTSIQWTDKTWNPVTGCTKVSPGCAHCYAEGVAERFWGQQYPIKYTDAAGSIDERARRFTEVWTHEDRLTQPLRWKKPCRIFVNSMSDLFHEDVSFEFIDQVFAVMALAGHHVFQVLTKRATRMFQYMTNRALSADYWKRACPVGYALQWNGISLVPFPLPNVWLGVSVENQHFADERIPLLLQTPAAIRFISAEPLLERITLRDWPKMFRNDHISDPTGTAYNAVDWVIVGGESGPRARPFDVKWARSIIEECRVSGVPCFVKQLGRDPFEAYSDGSRFVDVRLKDKKGGNMDEWPEDLRVREFPTTAHADASCSTR